MKLVVYQVRWRGFEDATRQVLPRTIAAKDRFAALKLLADELERAGVEHIPESVTVTYTDEEAGGTPRVLEWRMVGR